MGAWMLPAAAAAFACGLLAWPASPSWLGPSVALGLGATCLAVAWLRAGRAGRGPGPLARARLLPPEPPVIGPVTADPRTAGGAPTLVAVLALFGVLVLGAGWSGIHHRGLQRSLLSSLSPERVTIEATLKTDPRETTFGWSAVAQVTHVTLGEGTASVRSPVWVSGDETSPS